MTELPTVWGDRYNAGAKRGDAGPEDRCALCGRIITRAHRGAGKGLYLRMDSKLGGPILWDAPDEDDGGCFPVGVTCAREFPDGYVGELESIAEENINVRDR